MALQNSKYMSDILLNWQSGTATPAAPTTLYIALLTTLPTKNDGTGLVEASGTSYARQAITGSSGWNAITTNADNVTEQVTNNAAITWPAAGSAWGTILGIGVYDALTAGNLIEYGTLTSGSQVINTSNVFSIPIGDLTRQEN